MQFFVLTALHELLLSGADPSALGTASAFRAQSSLLPLGQDHSFALLGAVLVGGAHLHILDFLDLRLDEVLLRVGVGQGAFGGVGGRRRFG